MFRLALCALKTARIHLANLFKTRATYAARPPFLSCPDEAPDRGLVIHPRHAIRALGVSTSGNLPGYGCRGLHVRSSLDFSIVSGLGLIRSSKSCAASAHLVEK
jgi:hypothetical protein